MNTNTGDQGKRQRPGVHPLDYLRLPIGTAQAPQPASGSLRRGACVVLASIAAGVMPAQAQATPLGMTGAAVVPLIGAFSAPAMAVAVQRLPGRTPSEELVILKPPEKPAAQPGDATVDGGKAELHAAPAKTDQSNAGNVRPATAAPRLDMPGPAVGAVASKPASPPASAAKAVASKPAVGKAPAPATASGTPADRKPPAPSSKGSVAAKAGDKAAGKPQAGSRAPAATTATTSAASRQVATRKPPVAAAKPAAPKKSLPTADKQASTRKVDGKGRDTSKQAAKQVGSSGTMVTQSSAAKSSSAEASSKANHQLPPIIERSVESSR